MTRLLVVEDYPPLATVMAIALRRSSGHEVVRVGSVQRAEAAAAAAELGRFDLMVVDIDLPDGSGVDLSRRLLALGQVGGCVFFTASRDDGVLRSARELGPVVDKLAPVADLVRVVLEHLSHCAEAPPADEQARGVVGAAPLLDHGSGTRRRQH